MEAERARTSPDRLTSRLEAFSDLVFGFSLSLLATRLDIPARVEDIFDSKRWLAVIVTFALVCRFWLEHYRIFRHHFVARTFDMVANFVFLFAIAVLPYAVQTFLRFPESFPPLILYLGDLGLILSALALLRFRGLRLRRADDDLEMRLRDWRRTVLQISGAVIALGIILALLTSSAGYQTQVSRLGPLVLGAIFVSVLFARRGIKRLPEFLRAPGS